MSDVPVDPDGSIGPPIDYPPDVIAEGVTAIPGMTLAAPRFISIIGFTSTSIDLELVAQADHQVVAGDVEGAGVGVIALLVVNLPLRRHHGKVHEPLHQRHRRLRRCADVVG